MTPAAPPQAFQSPGTQRRSAKGRTSTGHWQCSPCQGLSERCHPTLLPGPGPPPPLSNPSTFLDEPATLCLQASERPAAPGHAPPPGPAQRHSSEKRTPQHHVCPQLEGEREGTTSEHHSLGSQRTRSASQLGSGPTPAPAPPGTPVIPPHTGKPRQRTSLHTYTSTKHHHAHRRDCARTPKSHAARGAHTQSSNHKHKPAP